MDLIRASERIETILNTFGVESLRPQSRALRALLSGGDVVDVAVMGRFKSGKSSFLNALIGRHVMPVDVLPSTAVVTRVGFGPSERAVVHEDSGEAFDIPVSGIADFVTEQGNPGNAKRVSAVEVELPALAPFSGIRFVDTPGLGSIFAHNTRASKGWMPRAGAALVAVSADHPLSEEDLALLNDVSLHTPEAAILLTKADLLSEGERESVIAFIRSQAYSGTGKEWRILPVSNRPGFETTLSEVRAHVTERIADRKTEVNRAITMHKLRGLLEGCRGYLRLALRSAESADAARERLRGRLAQEREDIGSVIGEIASLCRSLKSEARTAADVKFQSYRQEVAARIAGEMHEVLPGWSGNLARVSRAFETWLAGRIAEEMGTVSMHGEDLLAGYPSRARRSVSRSVQAFQDRLAKQIEDVLGIRFAGAHFETRVEEPSRPDVRLSPVFDTHVELLWFLVPMPVFRPLVVRHFRHRIPWEAEKNLSRLAAQWADAVGAVIDSLAQEAGAFLQRELDTIEAMVGDRGETGSRAASVRRALAELASLESAIS